MSLRNRRDANRSLVLAMALLCLTPTARGQERPPRRIKIDMPARTAQREPRSAAPQNAASVPATREKQPPRGGHLGKFMPQPRKPRAPWELDEQQQATLDLVLAAWEKKSTSIKSLTCRFTLWEYDFIFGAEAAPSGKPPRPTRVSRGEIKYATPDRGVYHITHQAGKGGEFEPREGAYWVCDGQAVYEFNHEQQRLYERRLPNELKGSAISSGPLPFLFGASAEQMRSRYWLKVNTPAEVVGKEIRLDAVPKHVEDRANYQQASIILSEKDMLPVGLRLVLPEGNQTSYRFEGYKINSLWKKIIGDFDVPPLPEGWDHIVEEAPRDHGRPALPAAAQTLRVDPPRSRQRQ